MQFETLSVHGGQSPDPTTLARGVPVHRASSYVFKSTQHASGLTPEPVRLSIGLEDLDAVLAKA
jgi:O-acetylhomoserine/O-acetylserine sulfhydrylase-like pyridoxal-dependent enzyme